MKKIVLGVSLMMAILFTGCNNDDNSTDNGCEIKYLHYADARDNMSTEDRARYADYCWRLERKDKAAAPKNWRTCRGDFVESEETALLEPDYTPSLEGLRELRISGSSDFSYKELDYVKTEIRKLTDAPIYIIDVRGESHGFINGQHVSRYGLNNWSNVGKTHEQILADEATVIHATLGQTIDLFELKKTDGYQPVTPIPTEVTNAQTEKEACAERDLGYARFTVPDRAFPGDSELDRFISFVSQLPANAWLHFHFHFHCQAGAGRTTQYMIFYDIMRNPGVSMKDIAYRQCLIGGNYLLYDGSLPGEDPVKAALCAEKAEMISLFYRYVQENRADGYRVTWSQWKSEL